MNLAYYPFQLITTKPSVITVIDTGLPKVLLDLVQAFRNDDDGIVLSNEQMQIQELRKASLWIGDPVLELDLDKLFQRLIIKKVSQLIEDRRLIELIEQSQRLAMSLLREPLLSELPVTVEPGGKLEQIMKYCNVHFDEEVLTEPFSKVEAAIQTLAKLEEKRLVIFANISHYLDIGSLSKLLDQVKDTSLELLLIEFSDVERRKFFEKCQYIYIDKDFMDSRELID